jgi:hypothetical protein
MTEAELQMFRLAQFAQSILVPATEAFRTGEDETRRLWALGALLEAGARMCLGAELEYFPAEKSLVLLERTVGRTSKLPLVGELWGRVVGNSWVEQLGHGNLEEALAVRVLPDAQGERPQLFAHFQAELVLTMERANDGAAERFLRALLLESDAQWSADLRQHRQWLTSLGEDLPNPAASRAWNAAADGEAWILDGLLRCLVQLEAVLGWAEVIQGRSFDESETSPYSSLAPPGAEEVLVTSVGRILSWRLYRGNGQVRDRLEEAVGLAGDVERLLVDAQTIASPWPEGLRATVDRTLDRWETMASQRVFG